MTLPCRALIPYLGGIMIKLENGNALRATLSDPAEKHDYYFDLEAGTTVTITFVAPSLEYGVKSVAQAYPLEKGGPANAHNGGDLDFTTKEIFTFSQQTKHRVYLTVASANAAMLPSAGYTIAMAVAGH